VTKDFEKRKKSHQDTPAKLGGSLLDTFTNVHMYAIKDLKEKKKPQETPAKLGGSLLDTLFKYV